MHIVRSGLSAHRFRLALVLGVVIASLAIPSLIVSAQAEDFKQRVFSTLIALPDEYFSQLVDLMAMMDADTDMAAAFTEAPREFLLAEGIELAPDVFQVIGLDFSILPEVEGDPWFGIAEPLEGLVYEPKGIGVFFDSVAVFIQEAFEPVDEGAMPEMRDHQTDMLTFVGDRFPGDTLDLVGAAVLELDALDADDPRRLEFLANPREYLLEQQLTLPASAYRIIAVDLLRAGVVGGVASGVVRPGLGTIPEGIGIFYDNVGVFLQRAI